jgi:hypothetical protein
MKKALETLDDLVLKAAQKVVDKAYDIGYDKYDVLKAAGILTGVFYLANSAYGFLSNQYREDSYYFIPLIDLGFSYLFLVPNIKYLEELEKKELNALENNVKYIDDHLAKNSFLRKFSLISSLTFSALGFYVISKGIPFTNYFSDDYSQNIAKLNEIVSDVGFNVLVSYVYLFNTTPKPPSAKKQKLWGRFKDAAREYLAPKPELIPIPIKKPGRRYR